MLHELDKLAPQKKQRIINAALRCFAKNGYKKTSTSDVATAAEISKAMVFHYFGTKKQLYLYLANYCGALIYNTFEQNKPLLVNKDVTDFFERVKLSSSMKVKLMTANAEVATFVTSMYFEQHPDVRSEIEAFLKQGEAIRQEIGLTQIDTSKFKPGVDPQYVMKMLTWMAEGMITEIPKGTDIIADNSLKEFDVVMEILRNNFYKEEYL